MKRRNYKHYIRRTHRYLGIFIGIQFVFWTVGGLYFSWTNIKEIRGDHLRAESEMSIKFDRSLVSPQVPAEKLVASGVARSIEKVRVVDVLGTPHYEIGYRTPDEKDELAVADAITGNVRPPMSEDEAIRIAADALRTKQPVRSVALITNENVGGHHEYREKPLPAWAVSFENSDNLTVYLSQQTGQIGAFRTGSWRIFDFLWMLHTMDFNERDNINNWLLRGFSALGLLTIASGFLLFFVSSKPIRRLFASRRDQAT
ncbi:MAG TPA: hypothetical protein PKA82_02540 [Pyrinomonadaceae bacterium]|nr:hypothetical protein [Pyrinomonadaceae bacterium]